MIWIKIGGIAGRIKGVRPDQICCSQGNGGGILDFDVEM